MLFTKNLRLVVGLAKGSTLRLLGSGLKFCKEDLNMAAINFSPLQNLDKAKLLRPHVQYCVNRPLALNIDPSNLGYIVGWTHIPATYSNSVTMPYLQGYCSPNYCPVSSLL